MESYPRDLLAGVFPLVFCVDAILPAPVKDGTADSADEDAISKRRSLFERFLDAMAACDIEGEESSASAAKPLGSILRAEYEDDSSDDEDISGDSSSGAASGGATPSSNRRTFRRTVGSPTLGMTTFRKTTAKSPQGSPPSNKTNDSALSYARNVTVERFFQRARILSISTRHGFPPSKDPNGEENFTLALNTAKSAMSMHPTNKNAARLKRVLEKHPIDGILPSGWLEKHANALPSVLIIVTTYDPTNSDSQEEQQQHLLETMEHLKESLATKRQCQIHLVVVTDSPNQCASWIKHTQTRVNLGATDFTVLTTSDLRPMSTSTPGVSTPSALQQLYKTVRTASWSYYRNQAKRNKKKLNYLGHDHQNALMPLAIRYCFKTAMFYEFMLKHEKALKYYSQAYSHLRNYYGKLIGNETLLAPAIVNPQGDDGVETSLPDGPTSATYNNDGSEGDTGVEVSLAESDESEEDDDVPLAPIDVRSVFAEMNPTPDMGHQCRAVADWLNFKVIQDGLYSSTFSESDGGLLAAATQWRKHAQLFLKPDSKGNPSWNHWLYVAQQRHCVSQLFERYPPKSIVTVSGLAKDEVLQQLSAWRSFLSTADAMLRCNACIGRVKDEDTNTIAAEERAKLRGRYVGGLDSEWLTPVLKSAKQIDYKEKAMTMVLHAISMFEAEIDKEKSKEKADMDKIASFYYRSGARLYYTVGGILVSKQEFRQAIPHLEKAVQYSSGWTGLELAIRRLLIECYEKDMATQAELSSEQSNNIASMILDSYFNAKMSSRNLRRALDNFSKLSSKGPLKWYHECIDESDSSLPFSFSVTFPGKTHATVSDTVTAGVLLRSNLDYAVHVNSVTLKSMAGDIKVPSMSLLSAENANEGSDGGIIIQAQTEILFSTKIDLPKDIAKIESDDSGNGGEKEAVAGKGSFAKSARPRSAGITSAAGARLISEHRFGRDPRDRNAQWSVRYLGGKTLRCDGMCLVFYPVHSEKVAGSGDLSVIEVTIVKKKPKTAANIRRTPFEEDNYVASAWTRPSHLHLSRGPRCLRVLGPIPKMLITNLTDTPTNGKALEGTVNRILLKLEAGSAEECRELRYKISCSSTLLSMDGKTTVLGPPVMNGSGTTIEQPEVPAHKKSRTPVMVISGGTSGTLPPGIIDYELPPHWTLQGSGFGMPWEIPPPVSSLKPGEACYVYFDLYRPTKTPKSSDLVDENGGLRSTSGNGMEETELCETTFDVSVTYRQSRPKPQKVRSRRRRPPPGLAPGSEEGKDDSADSSDLVSLDFSSSVVWVSPLSAEFSEVHRLQKAHPGGSRHPSNHRDDGNQLKDSGSDDGDPEIALINGERVATRCSLEATYVSTDLTLEVQQVRFEKVDPFESNIPCEISLLGQNTSQPETIVDKRHGDPARRLKKGSKFGFIYVVEAKMSEEYIKGSVSSHLGTVCVDWAPVSLPLPKHAAIEAAQTNTHGPLALSGGTTMKFRGLPCYVENAPFAVKVSMNPQSAHVGVPFSLCYRLENKTSMHQRVSVALTESGAGDTDTVDVMEQRVLLCGLVDGKISLAPKETQILSFTAVATNSGEAHLPALSISSDRFKTWLVDDGSVKRTILVLP